MPTPLKYTINLLIILAISCYAGINLNLYVNQRNILYVPDKNLSEPIDYGLANTTTLRLTTTDNINITAWYIAAKPGFPTILYFHGNAGNLGKRVKKFTAFTNKGFGLLAVSYRGYGSSEGSPTEEGLYNDARAGLAYLDEKGIKTNEIILYGESLGTGVAVQIATEHDFRALVLEAPYETIAARGAELYPYIPVDFLLKDKFDSLSKIGKINTAVLFFHSEDDEVMPIHHGERLFASAHEPKLFKKFTNNGHSDFNWDELAGLVVEFVKDSE